MRSKKIVFIIPGFRHKITQKGYKNLMILLKRGGYLPIASPISWKGSTIFDNTEHFLNSYQKKLKKLGISSRQVYLLGFSYGALIAFLAATKVSVKGLILCSLSPFFKEDLPKKLSKNLSLLQKTRHDDFSKISMKMVKKVKTKKALLLYGSRESTKLITRVNKTYQLFPFAKKYIFSIENAAHNIADKKYITAIHHAASLFL